MSAIATPTAPMRRAGSPPPGARPGAARPASRAADRQIGRQRQILEAEGLLRLLGGQATEQRGQLIACLPQLLLQRRQGLRGLRFRRLLRQQIEIAGGAELRCCCTLSVSCAAVRSSRSVAVICPRSDCFLHAVTTTLLLKVR
jgi:hypothetical protein